MSVLTGDRCHTHAVEEDDPGKRRRIDEEELAAGEMPVVEGALEPGDFTRWERARHRVGSDLCRPGDGLQDERGDKDARNEPPDTHRVLLPLVYQLLGPFVLLL
jgi:hypothetical protein